MMNSALLQRLKPVVRELGPMAAILYGLDRWLRRISSRSKIVYYRFLAQPLRDQPRLPPGRGIGYEFRLLNKDEPVLDALDRPRHVINQRFAQGAQCLLATKNQEVAGYIWFLHQTYLEDEVRAQYVLPTEGRCVWDFDVYVAPSERLGWLFAKQWDVLDALLQPRGVRYSFSRINAFNQRSLASHRRLGAVDCGWAVFLCVGNGQLMLSNMHPYLAWGGLPRLHVRPKGAL